MKRINSIDLAYEIRINALRMVNHAHASHIGGILSCADLVAVLFSDVAKLNPQNHHDDNRDRIILSKGHNGVAINVALAKLGFFDEKLLESYGDNGTPLSCHISHKKVPGVEISTGSLGQGVCVACGMAIDAKRKNKKHSVYAIIGDGECNEGAVWEMAMLASQCHLDNFTVIIDRNNQQAMGDTRSIIDTEPLVEKWTSFGWEVIDVKDGHNHDLLLEAFKKPHNNKPKVIIARTIKGKGVSFMENQLLWHYRDPQGEFFTKAIEEVEANYEKSRNR